MLGAARGVCHQKGRGATHVTACLGRVSVGERRRVHCRLSGYPFSLAYVTVSIRRKSVAWRGSSDPLSDLSILYLERMYYEHFVCISGQIMSF